MKNHLHRAHMQYRSFKAARVEALQNNGIITIEIDLPGPGRKKCILS